MLQYLPLFLGLDVGGEVEYAYPTNEVSGDVRYKGELGQWQVNTASDDWSVGVEKEFEPFQSPVGKVIPTGAIAVSRGSLRGSAGLHAPEIMANLNGDVALEAVSNAKGVSLTPSAKLVHNGLGGQIDGSVQLVNGALEPSAGYAVDLGPVKARVGVKDGRWHSKMDYTEGPWAANFDGNLEKWKGGAEYSAKEMTAGLTVDNDLQWTGKLKYASGPLAANVVTDGDDWAGDLAYEDKKIGQLEVSASGYGTNPEHYAVSLKRPLGTFAGVQPVAGVHMSPSGYGASLSATADIDPSTHVAAQVLAERTIDGEHRLIPSMNVRRDADGQWLEAQFMRRDGKNEVQLKYGFA